MFSSEFSEIFNNTFFTDDCFCFSAMILSFKTVNLFLFADIFKIIF